LSDKPHLIVLLALLLPGCGDDAIQPHPAPITLSHPMLLGDEVVCVETLVRFSMPGVLPIIGWAKRTFTCELHRKPPLEHYK
jgi:hypothetical protein